MFLTGSNSLVYSRVTINSIISRIWLINKISKGDSKEYSYKYEKLCFFYKKLYIKSSKTVEYAWLTYSANMNTCIFFILKIFIIGMEILYGLIWFNF